MTHLEALIILSSIDGLGVLGIGKILSCVENLNGVLETQNRHELQEKLKISSEMASQIIDAGRDRKSVV